MLFYSQTPDAQVSLRVDGKIVRVRFTGSVLDLSDQPLIKALQEHPFYVKTNGPAMIYPVPSGVKADDPDLAKKIPGLVISKRALQLELADKLAVEGAFWQMNDVELAQAIEARKADLRLLLSTVTVSDPQVRPEVEYKSKKVKKED